MAGEAKANGSSCLQPVVGNPAEWINSISWFLATVLTLCQVRQRWLHSIWREVTAALKVANRPTRLDTRICCSLAQASAAATPSETVESSTALACEPGGTAAACRSANSCSMNAAASAPPLPPHFPHNPPPHPPSCSTTPSPSFLPLSPPHPLSAAPRLPPSLTAVAPSRHPHRQQQQQQRPRCCSRLLPSYT